MDFGRVAALVITVVVMAAPARPAQAARRVFLWFSDGGTPPKSVGEICPGGRPSAFRCQLGPSVDDCRQPIQALLDQWYADADVVFTHTEPPEGAFDTVILTSEGTWCGSDARTVSRSPLPLCTAVPRGTIAIFRCGDDSKKCATLIAKEQGHLLGLQHSVSPTDVMNELGETTHDGFENRDNALTSARCGRLQNSYNLLIERTGAWPGGPKPRPEAPASPAVDAATADGAGAGIDAGAGVDAQAADGAPEDSAGAGEDSAGAGDVPPAGPGAPRDPPPVTTPVTPAQDSGGCSYGAPWARSTHASGQVSPPRLGSLTLAVVAAWLVARALRRSRESSCPSPRPSS